GGSIADNLLLHYVFDLLTCRRHWVGGACIGSRCHDGDITGKQNKESGGCGTSAVGTDPRNDRNGRGKDGRNHFTHGVDKAARSIEAENNCAGVNGLGVVDSVADVGGTHWMDNVVEIYLDDGGRAHHPAALRHPSPERSGKNRCADDEKRETGDSHGRFRCRST